jgi:hypothetical protein
LIAHKRCVGGVLLISLLIVGGCGGAGQTDAVEPPDSPPLPAPPVAFAQDVLSTSLMIDLSDLTGQARITALPDDAGELQLSVQGLQVLSVETFNEPATFDVRDGRMRIHVAPGTMQTELTVDYVIVEQVAGFGLLEGGSTYTWPYFCGMIFPCNPDPADGLRFELELAGVAEDVSAVHPARIDADAPVYQLGWAVDAYEYHALGSTQAGTEVGLWVRAVNADAAMAGAADLVGVFDWYETNLGLYRFGRRVASVAVDWGPGAGGGIEHHPFWHIGLSSLGSAEHHAHEAAHGWFGDGIRIACWEDFVLSEGTVSYLAAIALGAVAGEQAETALWARYQAELKAAIAGDDFIVWPQGCGAVDVLDDLFSLVTYRKGAFFLRAVERDIGRPALVGALAAFYAEYAGGAAGMQDLIDLIRDSVGYDAVPLADLWLRSLGIPEGAFAP